jgi:hypothetical protein
LPHKDASTFHCHVKIHLNFSLSQTCPPVSKLLLSLAAEHLSRAHAARENSRGRLSSGYFEFVSTCVCAVRRFFSRSMRVKRASCQCVNCNLRRAYLIRRAPGKLAKINYLYSAAWVPWMSAGRFLSARTPLSGSLRSRLQR